MSSETVPGGIDRHSFHKTRHRGFTYRLLANGSKQFWGYIPGKGRVRLQAQAEREALAEWRDVCGRVAKGERIAPANVRFREIAEQWFDSKHRLRPWTRKLYRAALDNELLPRFGHLKLAQIDPEMIARFIRKLDERGLSSSTISNYLLPLSGTFAFATRRGLVSVNPCALLTSDDRPEKRERRRAYEWTDDEIDALIKSSEQIARRRVSQYDYSPLIRVAIFTGLRLGELLGLQWQDICFDECVLHVRRQYTRTGELAEPKTPKALRRVPLSADMAALLKRHKLKSPHSLDEEFVFGSNTGGPLSHRNVQRRGFEAARDHAALSHALSFHDLRHAFASLAAHRGVPEGVLSEVMGHTHVGITQKVYRHLYDRPAAEQAFREAMART
jgi:integrase